MAEIEVLSEADVTLIVGETLRLLAAGWEFNQYGDYWSKVACVRDRPRSSGDYRPLSEFTRAEAVAFEEATPPSKAEGGGRG